MREGDEGVDEALAYFLDLRVRVRGNRYATGLVDRCLQMMARAATAQASEFVALEREIADLRDELELLFGPSAILVRH